MQLPPFPEISEDTLRAIVAHNGLDVDEYTLLPETGLFNRIYQLGDELILRISRDHPKSFVVARREALAVPLGRAAGMRTPALLVYDPSCAVIPVPYTIYERVPGDTLGLLDLEPHDTPDVWRELGRDLARLHAYTRDVEPLPELEYEDVPDPRPWPDELAEAGHFSASEARWLSGWLDRLAPAALATVPRCLRHGDTQSTNVIVEAGSLAYMAVIDWGSTQWGDPAYDLAGSPVSCMANVHCAEATENFLVLENHSVDDPEWSNLVTGLPNPLVQDGHIVVPDKPGLGFDGLNEEYIREHLDPDRPGYFEPTEEWDVDRSNDRLWS